MTITEKLREIDYLCKDLGINPDLYKDVKDHGRLIFRLSEIQIFKKGDLKSGRIAPPDPKDYMGEEK